MKVTGKVTQDIPRSGSAQRHPVTWLLVIDRHIVRIFRKNGHGIEHFGEISPTDENEKELTNRSIGRVGSSAGRTILHKYEPRTNQSLADMLRFVHEIADWLNESVQADAFDRLVMVAPPKMIGHLRKLVSDEVRSRIVAAISKDLTKLPEIELQEELKKIV